MRTQVKTCERNARASECAKLMAEHHIGLLPVVDHKGKLVGVVTDRDLALRVLGRDRSGLTSVSQVMTTDLVTCRPDDDLRIAEERLMHSKKRRIIVVASDETVVGVLSLSDIAQVRDSRRAGLVFSDVTRPDLPRRLARR